MDFRIKCDLGSISPKFYSQLLRAQIPKEQKIQENHQSFFSLLGSVCIKASSKLLVKSTPCLGTEDFVFGTEIYFSFAKFIYNSLSVSDKKEFSHVMAQNFKQLLWLSILVSPNPHSISWVIYTFVDKK